MSKHVERNLLKYNIFGYIMIPSSKRNLGKHPKEVKLMGLKGMKQKIQIGWTICKVARISCSLFVFHFNREIQAQERRNKIKRRRLHQPMFSFRPARRWHVLAIHIRRPKRHNQPAFLYNRQQWNISKIVEKRKDVYSFSQYCMLFYKIACYDFNIPIAKCMRLVLQYISIYLKQR